MGAKNESHWYEKKYLKVILRFLITKEFRTFSKMENAKYSGVEEPNSIA